jgi:p-cumate 2,3-dioxygenase subunit alpha
MVEQLIDDNGHDGRFRVHRSALTSQEVFDLEISRIFDHTWLYIGHEMEIPNVGDYRRRTVAGKPLFMVRSKDGEVRAFHNTCTHRGAQVCRQDAGHAQSFQCFYHGWTFDTKGELVGVPDEPGYAGVLRKSDYALMAPRLESYRGFYFVTFDPDIEDLKTYLGGAREVIDLTMDSAEVLGGWMIMRGTAKWRIQANWKLLVENSHDGYHLATVHQTFFEYQSWRQQLTGKTGKRPNAMNTQAFALRGGHGGIHHEAAGRGIANATPIWSDEANAEVERIKALNIARFGEERGRRMCETSRHMVIFPTLAFQDSQSSFRVRQINPVAPGIVDAVQWDFVPRDEHPELRASRIQSSLAFLGPGGLATPDDVEALESCQLGYASGAVEWSDLSRGMHRASNMNDELQMRAFWRQWHSLIQGKDGAIDTADEVPSVTSLGAAV